MIRRIEIWHENEIIAQKKIHLEFYLKIVKEIEFQRWRKSMERKLNDVEKLKAIFDEKPLFQEKVHYLLYPLF